MNITPEQAGARVLAGLGRNPQDALESTVVLEAWGGVVPRTALRLSRGVVDRAGLHPGGVHRQGASGTVTGVSTREVLGLIATLLATTAWVAPLGDELGHEVIATAWQIALPISLALQWLLRRRHLNGPDGLGSLRADRPVVAAAVVLCCSVPVALMFAPSLTLPAALIVTWVGGLLIVVRGWGVAYAALLVGAIWAIELGVPVLLDVILVVLWTGVVLVLAMLTAPLPSARPTPWRRSLPAGLAGGTMALLIVSDPAVEWSSSKPFPVVALVPSLLASVWAGRHLNRIWTVLLGALASTGLLHGARRRNWRVFAAIVAGSLGRLLMGTLLFSTLAFVLLRDSADSDAGLARLLLGLGAFGVVGFVVALLESFSRVASAVAVALASVLAAQVALVGPFEGLRGLSLPVAAAAALLTALVPVIGLVRQPDRTLATLFS